MPKTMDEFIQEHQQRTKTIIDRAKDLGRKGVRKVKDGVKWIVENPQEAAIVGTIVTGVAAGLRRVTKSVDKYVTARRETYNKERYIYDHSANAYLKTKRALKNNDVARINDLRRNNPGMKMSEALQRLNLLD